jgi:hypothetical protein
MTLFIFLQETVCIPTEMYDAWGPIEEFASAEVECVINEVVDDTVDEVYYADQISGGAIDLEVMLAMCFI